MIGLGTLINVGAIIIGGLLGLFLGRNVKVRYQDILMIAVGICVLMLGIGGTMEQMLSITDGRLASGGSMMLIITMAVGALAGEWMNIEKKMEQFGVWLKKKTGSNGDNAFVDAFVTTSLTVCIGSNGSGWGDSGRDLRRLQYSGGKGNSGFDYCIYHDGFDGKGVYPFCDSCWNFSGTGDAFGEAD